MAQTLKLQFKLRAYNMTKFNGEMYEKGYNDGYADALNNLELVDILEHIQDFSDEDKQKIIDAIKNCE